MVRKHLKKQCEATDNCFSDIVEKVLFMCANLAAEVYMIKQKKNKKRDYWFRCESSVDTFNSEAGGSIGTFLTFSTQEMSAEEYIFVEHLRVLSQTLKPDSIRGIHATPIIQTQTLWFTPLHEGNALSIGLWVTFPLDTCEDMQVGRVLSFSVYLRCFHPWLSHLLNLNDQGLIMLTFHLL